MAAAVSTATTASAGVGGLAYRLPAVPSSVAPAAADGDGHIPTALSEPAADAGNGGQACALAAVPSFVASVNVASSATSL